MQSDTYEKVMDLAKRRGYVWQSFEIYGGSAGFYDYGPLGAALKRRLEDSWRRLYCTENGYYEIDSTYIGVESVFNASGHLSSFTDLITVCTQCKEPFRADHLLPPSVEVYGASSEELTSMLKDYSVVCPVCGGALGPVEEYNLMFSTNIGPGTMRRGYLRPETAQGIFINFQRLLRFNGNKLPFGVAQVGRAFRNEISPRQGMIRLREFTQAELELFVHPHKKDDAGFETFREMEVPLLSVARQEERKEPIMVKLGDAVSEGIIAHETLAHQIGLCWTYLLKIGLDPERLRLRQHLPDEMAHYAMDCWDAEAYSERFGWIEIVGIADRTDYDLKAHMKFSGEDLNVFYEYPEPVHRRVTEVKIDMSKLGPLFRSDAKAVADAIQALPPEYLEEDPIKVEVEGKEFNVPRSLVSVEEKIVEIKGERIIPHVIEPSFGIDRILYMLLEHSYNEDEVEGEIRRVLRLNPHVAPIPIAVLPLMSKQELISPAKRLVDDLRKRGIWCEYDEGAFIGRRYRRFDEVGTPYCITIDYQTLEDSTVTIRERDSLEQVRVALEEIPHVVHNLIHGIWDFEKLKKS